MGKEEFAKVMVGIVNDGELAERVAGGDFGEGDLTAAEQALLSAAAGDLEGDVSGFGEVIPKLEVHSWKVTVDNIKMDVLSPNLRNAVSYLKLGDIKGE